MKKSIQIFVIVLGLVLMAAGLFVKIPSKELTTYSVLAGKYSVIEEYVGGDAYNYIIGASLVGGEIAGAKAQKAIFISIGALIISIGLLSTCKNNKKSEDPMDSHFIAQNDFKLEKADVDIAERTSITDETETDEKYTSTN